MKRRLDHYLADLGRVPSRARARDAIKRGCVKVNGVLITKPGQLVAADQDITLDDPAEGYVSRAALKLLHAVEAFSLDFEDRHVLDIGASTGGFSQVALMRGARRVTAIDVGHDQLADVVRADPRVAVREGLNARDLTREDLDAPVEAIVCDVSFISLKLALPPALNLAEPGSLSVFLIKPQFEVGREGLGKNGVVSDPALVDGVCGDIVAWLGAQARWRVVGTAPSPVEGADGNREFLLVAVKDRL